MNIQNGIGEGFGYIERAYSMVVNAYFGTWHIKTPHATPTYGPGKSKVEVDYYIKKYCSQEKVAHTRKKTCKK